MEILRVENLRKEYGRGEARVNALDGISFSVEKGEFVAIIRTFRVRKIYAFAHFGRRRQTNLGKGVRK